MADLKTYTERAVAFALKAGATSADAIAIGSNDVTTSIRNGEPETIERAESRGVGLRVFVGQSSASLSSSELSDPSLQEMAEKTVAIAKVAPADPFAGLADPALLAKNFPDLELADATDPDMETLQRLARETEEAGLAVKGITNSEGADAGFSRTDVGLTTSTGFSGAYSITRHSLSLSLIAGKGDTMERDYEYYVAAHAEDMKSPEAIGKEAARRTLERMKPRKVGSQQAAILFDPRVGKSLLSAFANATHGSAVARGTSFLKADMGKQIFAENISIIDDPFRKRGLGSHTFDGEGVAPQKRTMLKNGVLQSWFLDSRSARQLKLQTTGHATRGLSGNPHPSSTNLYIEAGTKSPAELMKEIGTGLYVTETIGHGTNIITGDYSLGATGFWIENGELAYPVSEITIAGNLREMFKSLQVANDLVFRYGTNVPTIAIPAMTIAGN